MTQFHDNPDFTQQGEVAKDHSSDAIVAAFAELGHNVVPQAKELKEQVVLVAFTVNAGSPMHAQTMLMQELAKVDLVGIPDGPGVEAWWIAMDERYDRSDCDSAVFVHQGMQADVQELLVKAGASAAHNLPLTGG